MTEKSYNSGEYIAQQFTQCIKGEGGYAQITNVTGWRAEHHGNRIDFQLDEEFEIVVQERGKRRVLELYEKSGKRIDTMSFDVRRSPAGRISPSALTEFFKEEILPRARRYIRQKRGLDSK